MWVKVKAHDLSLKLTPATLRGQMDPQASVRKAIHSTNLGAEVTKLVRFNPETDTVGIGRNLTATLVPARPDPPFPVDGLTFGVATMSENSPHGGEMHPDGDELIYLVSGRARVTLESDPVEELVMEAGEGLVVPKGVWHRVEILTPSQIVYVTPGPNNRFRTLENED